MKEKRKHLPMAQMTHLASFGPIFVVVGWCSDDVTVFKLAAVGLVVVVVPWCCGGIGRLLVVVVVLTG